MKAVVYEGPRKVGVVTVPDARLERHTDVLVRVTAANICGSDLHMYEGRTDFEPGRILGHENLGEVVEVGAAVDRVRVGDMVCMPFNVSCGFCANCENGLTAFCLTTNPEPGRAGAAYGYAGMGPYQGGQAELLRVPYGDFNCLVLPEDARERQNDYVMLADVWPTGWHATELARVQPGDTVVIYGAGPVGLMAAYSALLRNASGVMVIDHHPDRLAKAEEIGAIAIDDSVSSPVEQVLELTEGLGADRGCECVGFQAHDAEGSEHPSMTLNNLVKSVKFTGCIAVVGLFVPTDPIGGDALYRRGAVAIDYGTFWSKGQTMSTGQCNVKNYNRQLCALIHEVGARPSWIVSHDLDLDDAPEAYARFDARDRGWTKVVLHPGKPG
ncbi:alcohol dehydrogenase catalytic domain-containing protein [Microbispora cellulosiformans]|uniref:Alcohol dehydrogenase catalytic domain-containing protein n=1 Tax=Microbispora cellulosiformans TaxID=2614688 RepID=A0A5J5K3F8_9ACTN|nr:glutathione-independent formaldehyde dehydrogenase [Microbispora cellulosiformans]KAA9378524.1 alcohol dehydrogenase catalytic domain-containing protein [Microbispora cellulosiformans]